MRKVTVELTVKLVLNSENDIDISDIIDTLEYDFVSGESERYDVEDQEILDFEVIDSR